MARIEISIPDSRSKLVVAAQKMPFAVDNRVTAWWWAWERRGADYLLGVAPHSECPANAQTRAVSSILAEHSRDFTEATIRGYYKISVVTDTICRVTLVSHFDMGGKIAQIAMSWAMKRMLGVVKRTEDRFERSGKEVDAEMRYVRATAAPSARANDRRPTPMSSSSCARATRQIIIFSSARFARVRSPPTP
jgi:hypothetical protein